MRRVVLFLALAISFAVPVPATPASVHAERPVAATAAPDVCSLHGKVKFVDSFPDYKVQVVSSFPDLKVKRVTSFPDHSGEWMEVDSFPDFTVQLVDSFPDFKIQYVDSFPGCS